MGRNSWRTLRLLDDLLWFLLLKTQAYKFGTLTLFGRFYNPKIENSDRIINKVKFLVQTQEFLYGQRCRIALFGGTQSVLSKRTNWGFFGKNLNIFWNFLFFYHKTKNSFPAFITAYTDNTYQKSVVGLKGDCKEVYDLSLFLKE